MALAAPAAPAEVVPSSWYSEPCSDGSYPLISQPIQRWWMEPADWKCMYICNGAPGATEPLLALSAADCDARVQETITCPCE